MASPGRQKKRSPSFLITRLAKKEWFSRRLLALLDRFLKKERLRRALRRVIRRNSREVCELLDVWTPEADRRELDAILLSRSLEKANDPGEPVCSVIIPVFNNGALTYSCIKTVLLARTETPFEIIAVDNGSTDCVPDVLDHFKNRVTVIANDGNRGFVEACNQGAAAARGEFFLFLNNDTRVTDGWLDRLVETARRFGDAGAVGGKLLFPDGTIQEAGGIIQSDASGVNYGKWDDADSLKYNFLREVDYCSGACLLVRRALFERIGGFDTRFAPAYYEDADLCFALRAIGARVLYQPLCEITHVEGATAGTDADLGLKRFQKINRKKFAAKWTEALAAQPPPSSRKVDAAADRRRGRRVVVFDAQVPSFDRDAGSLRMFSVLDEMTRLGCQLSFVLREKAAFDGYGRTLGGIGVRLVPEKEIWKELAAGWHDLVLVSRVAMAERFLERIGRAAPDVPVLFDTVDLHFLRESRAAELTGDKTARREALETKKKELEIARSCVLTLTATETDRRHLLDEDRSLAVEVLPTVHAPVAGDPRPEGRRALMFIGGFRHPPNGDAMTSFVKETLPLIRSGIGDVEFLIVGNAPPAEVRALSTERTVVTGYVPDTTPYFAKSRVFVCPLRYGSGMKGKIGEALSHGVPVVTTSIGAEGMELVHGETALIHDDPSEFAAAVVRLFGDDDLWRDLSRKGREHINSRFGPAALRERLKKILAAVDG